MVVGFLGSVIFGAVLSFTIKEFLEDPKKLKNLSLFVCEKDPENIFIFFEGFKERVFFLDDIINLIPVNQIKVISCDTADQIPEANILDTFLPSGSSS